MKQIGSTYHFRKKGIVIQTKFSESFITIDIFNKMKTFKMPKSKSDQPIALDRAHLGSRLHRSRGQSSVLESWRSLGSPQLPGPSFPAYESPPTANRRVHWWGFYHSAGRQPANSTPRPAGGKSE